MNKKITAALIALTLLSPTAANAALKSATIQTPTIAILDTALDTSVPEFQGRIAYEVCILEWASCPNGQKEHARRNAVQGIGLWRVFVTG